MEQTLSTFIPGWRPLFEILTLWFVIYHILLFFEGTRAIQVLRGIIFLLVIFFLPETRPFGDSTG